MDMRQPFTFAFALLVGFAMASLLTWAACRWWYKRQLHAAAERLRKSDQGRVFSQQQTMQAKRQIEALKAELAEHRRAATVSNADQEKTRKLEQALVAAERCVEEELARVPVISARGFADTQILP